MRNPAAATRLPRLGWILLLAGTALGLAAMHTLGHSTCPRTTMTAGGHHIAAPATMAFASTAGNSATAASATPGSVHDGMDAWSVCLAVLGVAAAALLLTALPLRPLLGHAGAGHSGHHSGRPRPPPRRPPAGLLVADLSILRI